MTPFRAVAVDYDGTLTGGGRPLPSTLDALIRTRRRGVRIVLVTGRILAELRAEFPEIDAHVDRIVTENGAVLVDGPRVELLAPSFDPELVDELARHGVASRRGEVILATRMEHLEAVTATLAARGTDFDLVANRSELMVVPRGVTKASGLRAALAELGINRHSVVAVGDAENDHAMLQVCELGVAVTNAVESLKEAADVVTNDPAGDGVREVLEGPLLRGDERIYPARWQLLVGADPDGFPVTIPSTPVNVLVSGPSGTGKSYVAGMLTEQLVHLGYSVLVLDPEGDYEELTALPGVVAAGGSNPIRAAEIVSELQRGARCVVADLSLQPAEDVDALYRSLIPLAQAARADTGVPQWIVVDEAHVPLGPDATGADALTSGSPGHLIVTYEPERLASAVRDTIDIELLLTHHPFGSGVLTRRGEPDARSVRLAGRTTHHVRHWHKYTGTRLPPERGFWFRQDHHQRTGVVARSLGEFHEAIGRASLRVLRHHAGNNDFSRWIDDIFQDHELGRRIRTIEDEMSGAQDQHMLEAGRHRLLVSVEARLVCGPSVPVDPTWPAHGPACPGR